jgi:hypothetical protein
MSVSNNANRLATTCIARRAAHSPSALIWEFQLEDEFYIIFGGSKGLSFVISSVSHKMDCTQNGS